MRRTSIATAAVMLVMISAGGAYAQTQTGAIAGVIRDEQGGILPGVTVTLTGRTGAKTAVTDSTGQYRFVALEPDTYAIATDLSGFQAVRQEGIVLELAKQLEINLILKVASVSESVVVTGSSPIVDVQSSSTSNTISQTLLTSVPILRTNAATQILNYAPGVNSGSAFGGSAGNSNALLLDGVDTREPSSGGAYTFYNYNLVQEVQVGGLGAPAELGGFTGGVVNTVTKSGGNNFSALFDVQGAKSGLNRNNATSAIVAQNPALAAPNEIRKLLDYTVQLGGPLAQNRVFFFGSVQRFAQDTNPTGPITLLHEVSPRFNGKLTVQIGASDNITTSAQDDDYNQTGRLPGAPISAFQATDALTNSIDSPEYLFLEQWRHLFGSKTFTEVKYTQWTGYYDFTPQNNSARHFDLNTGEFSGSQGWILWGDRGRHQLNAAVSHFADRFGKHTLKFGAEIERSSGRDQFSYTQGKFFYDLGGKPYLMYTYGYDISAASHRQSVYAQDSWVVNGRVTVNPGLRADFIRGVAAQTGQEVFSTNSVAPRLGVAWDVMGDSRSVLKAFFGQFYEGAVYNYYSRAISGIGDFVGYDVTGPTPVEFTRTTYIPYRVDPNIKQPRVDEVDLAFERAIGPELRLSVTGMWRRWDNAIASVLPNARWTQATINNPLTNQPITVYRWANRPASSNSLLITNPDGFVYLDPSGNALGTANARRDYRSLMLVLNKRFSHRYQTQASYVLSHAFGAVDNNGSVRTQTRLFESPAVALVNVSGDLTNDRRHEFKLLGSYQIPVVDIALSGYYRILSGLTYTPFVSAPNAAINYPFSSGRNVLLEPRGSRRMPTENVADLRVEKLFALRGNDRVSVYLDLSNLFNASVITSVQNRVPSVRIGGIATPIVFDAAGGLIAPFQVRIGARWSF